MGSSGSCSRGQLLSRSLFAQGGNNLIKCFYLITGEVVQHEIPTFKVVLVGKFCKFDSPNMAAARC